MIATFTKCLYYYYSGSI